MTDARVRIEPQDIPPELDRWNWGAFLLNWIWGVGNNTYIALLTLVPLSVSSCCSCSARRGAPGPGATGAGTASEFQACPAPMGDLGRRHLDRLMLFGGIFSSVFYGFKHSDAYRLGAEKLRASSVGSRCSRHPDHHRLSCSATSASTVGSRQRRAEFFRDRPERLLAGVFLEAVKRGGVWLIRKMMLKPDGSNQGMNRAGTRGGTV